MEANRGSLIIYKDAETVIKLESDVEFNVNDHSMIPKSELSDIGAKKDISLLLTVIKPYFHYFYDTFVIFDIIPAFVPFLDRKLKTCLGEPSQNGSKNFGVPHVTGRTILVRVPTPRSF